MGRIDWGKIKSTISSGTGGRIHWGTPQQTAPQPTVAPTPVQQTKAPIQPVQIAPMQHVGLRQVGQQAIGVGRNVADFFTQSEQNLGRTVGQSAFALTGGQKQINDITKQNMNAGDTFLKLASKQKDQKRKALYIAHAHEAYTAAGNATEDILGHIRSGKEQLGDAAGVLLDALSFGSYGSAAKGAETGKLLHSAPSVLGGSQKATSVGKAFVQGAKAGAKASAPIGAAYGVAQGLQENKNLKGVAKSGLIGGVTGLVAGGLLGGAAQGLAARSAQQTADKASVLAQTTAQYVPSPELKIGGDSNARIQQIMKNSIDDTFGPLKNGKSVQGIFKGMQITDASGKIRPDVAKGRIQDIGFKLKMEFGPQAQQKFLSSVTPDNVTLSGLTEAARSASGGNLTGALSAIHAGGKTTPEQNAQLQEVIKGIRGQSQMKERGFVTTLKESAKTPQEVKDIIRGSYFVKSNESLTNDARKLVLSDPAAAEALALHPRNAVDIEVGNQLMAHYSGLGNHAKVAQIGEAMASSGTELGQAVQAFSQYDKTTPQGAIRYAQALIKQHNALGKNVVQLSDGHIKSIYDAAEAIQHMPIGRERNIATQTLMNEVKNLIPSTFGDKAITVWKAGLLTSLRTHERNILGNTLQAGAETAKDVPATLADKVMSLRTGQRTTTATLRGTLSGAKSGWRSAVDVVKYGYDPSSTIEKFDIHHVTWGNNPTEQTLKKLTDAVFLPLGAEDKVFLNASYARSLFDQAGAAAINAGRRGDRAFIEDLVAHPTENMLKNATEDSLYATFHDQTVMSKVANSVKRALGKHEATKVLGEVVAPFTGVPSSILGKMVDYSPVGFAKGIRDVGTVLVKNVPSLQRKAAQEIGRGVIGTGLLGLGAYLTKHGLMSGQPKDQAQSRQWELEGKKPNSVLVGGSWRSINSVGPQTLIVLAGSKAQESLQNGGGAAEFGGNIGKDFLGQTFLSGIQGPLNAIADPTRYGGQYLRGQISSVVPNIIKDTARSFDPSQRQSNSVLDSFKQSIPGWRNTTLPKRDVIGNVIPNDTKGVGSFIDLFNSSKPRTSPIISELSRLDLAGNNATPSNLNKNQTIQKQRVKLSPVGLDALESASSGELQSSLNALVQSPLYKSLDDEQKGKAIDRVVTRIRRKYKDNLPPIISVESTYTKSPDSSKNLFDLVGRYGKGFVKDPANTLRALFTPEHLRKVVGNATILERKDFLSLLDKGNTSTQVDHIIPLTLGGTNDMSNLRVISKEDNAKKAIVEEKLFKLLESGAIRKKDAQQMIREYVRTGKEPDVVARKSSFLNLGIPTARASTLPDAKTGEQRIANFIATLEGYKKKGSLADRQNNPGNLRYVGQIGAVRGERGFAKFKKPSAGFQALIKQLRLDASRNLTLRQFVYKYAPPSSNNSASYLSSIARGLGVDPNTKLSQILK